MQTFFIREVNVNSFQGKAIEAKDLTAAKRAAEKARVWLGTELRVYGQYNELLAVKQGRAWINV